MEFEVCFFFASRGSIVRGPIYETVTAEGQADAIGKFYQRHLGSDVHLQYAEPAAEIHGEAE